MIWHNRFLLLMQMPWAFVKRRKGTRSSPLGDSTIPQTPGLAYAGETLGACPENRKARFDKTNRAFNLSN
jgi:hypothetical protein